MTARCLVSVVASMLYVMAFARGPVSAQAPASAPAPSTEAAPSAVPVAATAPLAVPAAPAEPAAPVAATAAASSTAPMEESKPNKDSGSDIDLLKTPASPAFALVGVTPETVVRPTSPSEFAFAVYNAFTAGMPAGFALETAPYWWVEHKHLTYDDYRDANAGVQLLQNLSLSAASASDDSAVGSTKSVNIGFGLRSHVTIYTFKRSGKQIVDKATRDAETQVGGEQELRNNQRAYVVNNCHEGEVRAPCQKLEREIKNHRDAVTDAELARIAAELQAALDARQGIAIEGALAASWRSPADKVSFKDFARWAGWLTAGYEAEHWNLLAVGRYVRADDPGSAFLDVGGRAGIVCDRYGFFGEFIHRFVVDDPDQSPIDESNRISGTLEVRVGHDLFVSGTFGQDADSESGEGGVIALAGVSFQVGRERKVVLH